MADRVVPTDPAGGLRIGELSRRVGVSDHVLRAWERRYGLLRPRRSSGGFRLYTLDDERRVRRMQELSSRGLSAAEAARQTLAEDDSDRPARAAPPVGDGRLAEQRDRLSVVLDGYDGAAAEAILDGLLDEFTVETVMGQVLLPFLRELGDRWARGEASVAQEHFASGLLRARLLSLTRGWGLGVGPVALLACVPGERHDLPLLMLGICLRRQGWRITYLGPDTPLADVAAAAQEVAPSLIVLAAAVAPVADIAAGVSSLAERWSVAVGGRGVDHEFAAAAGVHLLRGDPVSAAAEVSAQVSAPVRSAVPPAGSGRIP